MSANALISAECAHLGYTGFRIEDKRTAAQKIYPGGEEGGSIDVVMNVQNFGRTPAWIIEGWSQAEITAAPLKCAELTRTTQGFLNPMPILPNAIDEPGAIHLDSRQWDDIVSKRKTLHIFGAIKYRDIFEQEHSSSFALTYSAVEKEFIPICIKTHWEYT